MPGKLVHTNELTVLLGDNWFAKCSAKQADTLVEHRKKRELFPLIFPIDRFWTMHTAWPDICAIFPDVKNALDDLQKVMKNFQNRADFTNDLEKLTGVSVLTMTSILCDFIWKPYTDVFIPGRNFSIRLKSCLLSQQGIGDFVDIREEVKNEDEVTKGKSSHAIRLF